MWFGVIGSSSLGGGAGGDAARERCDGGCRGDGAVRVSYDRPPGRGRGLAVGREADPAGAAELQDALRRAEVPAAPQLRA